MSASDDFPGLSALAEMLPDRAGGDEATRALAEIDRLRCENEALIDRRDAVMRLSGKTVEKLVRQIDQVRELCDSPYGHGYTINKIRDAIDRTSMTCACRIGHSGRGTYRQANPECPVHHEH